MEDQKKTETFVIDDSQYQTQLTKKFSARVPYAKPDPNKLLAFIPGVSLSAAESSRTTA